MIAGAEVVGHVVVYRCGTHSKVLTLCTDDAATSVGTRHVTGKCCVRQYQHEVARWRLTATDRDALVESLQDLEAPRRKQVKP